MALYTSRSRTICLFLATVVICLVQSQQIPSSNQGKDQEVHVDIADGETNDPTMRKSEHDFYSHSVYDHSGALVNLEIYKGKVSLVVNVASECGFTDRHYKSLIRLQNILSMKKGFTVLAFPCNQFGEQEPGSNEDIQRFTTEAYHPNFPIFSKVNVLEENVPGAWQYLIEKSGQAPTWNFWKYLVNENGHVVNNWGPWTPVEDIFHEVKEVVDKAGFNQQAARDHGRRGGEL